MRRLTYTESSGLYIAGLLLIGAWYYLWDAGKLEALHVAHAIPTYYYLTLAVLSLSIVTALTGETIFGRGRHRPAVERCLLLTVADDAWRTQYRVYSGAVVVVTTALWFGYGALAALGAQVLDQESEVSVVPPILATAIFLAWIFVDRAMWRQPLLRWQAAQAQAPALPQQATALSAPGDWHIEDYEQRSPDQWNEDRL